MAKACENSFRIPGPENSTTTKSSVVAKIQIILRNGQWAREAERTQKPTDAVRQRAGTPEWFIRRVTTIRKAVLISWQRPEVSFNQQISVIAQSKGVMETSSTDKPLEMLAGMKPAKNKGAGKPERCSE
jgi:hypothetical protein